MLQFNEISSTTNAKKNSFLPPIKNSENKFQLTNKNPVLIENSLSREKELLEVTLDKFSILTKQPSDTENIKFESCLPKSFGSQENMFYPPQATSSTNFEWNTKQMPRLKINKSQLPSSVNETPSDKKKRLLFEQKCALEQKQLEQNFRNLRSNDYLAHSNQTYSNIIKKRNSLKESAELHSKPDVWSSNNFKDINLQKDIINSFYNMEHRHIRYNRQFNDDFYKFTPNRNFAILQRKAKNLRRTKNNKPALKFFLNIFFTKIY